MQCLHLLLLVSCSWHELRWFCSSRGFQAQVWYIKTYSKSHNIMGFSSIIFCVFLFAMAVGRGLWKLWIEGRNLAVHLGYIWSAGPELLVRENLVWWVTHRANGQDNRHQILQCISHVLGKWLSKVYAISLAIIPFELQKCSPVACWMFRPIPTLVIWPANKSISECLLLVS